MARRVVRVLLIGAALILFSQVFFFYYRDNFSTHYPVKAVSAAAFRQLEIPFWNFAAGGGQPLAGNPNTLTFYPDNIFYLFLRTETAFNVHFLIHLLAGALAIRALLRRYGVDESSATLTALMYALSGPVISALAFYNLITAVALIPLAFLALEILLEQPGLWSSLVFGGVFGLLALAGEPMTFLGALLATAILAAHRFLRPLADGPSSGSDQDAATHWPQSRARLAALVLWGLVAVVITVLISLPLVLSYQEISSEVDRSTWKFSTQTVLAASLTPAQIAESVLGPYRGLLTDLGPAGLRANPSERGWPPLFLSTFLGVLLPVAFSVRGKDAAPYRWMFVILLSVALGRFNPLLESLLESFPEVRMVRYPEKLLLPMTTAGLVLVGLWLSRAGGADRRVRRGVIVSSAIVLLIALHFGVSFSRLSEVSRMRFAVAAVIATATLALALSRFRALAVAITIVLLAYWAVRAAPVDYAGPYRRKPAILESGVSGRLVRPVSDDGLQLPRPREAARYRLKAAMLDPVFGAVFGVEYGLDRSPDGMYYMLTRVVNERFEAAPLELKLRYLRLYGCTTVLLQQRIAHPALRQVRAASIEGNPLYRYELGNPVPYVRAARKVLPVRSVQEAVRLLESESFDERGSIIAAATHSRLGSEAVTIGNVRRDGQTVSFDIDAGSNAAVVVNETYFSRWDVRAVRPGAEERLDIFPANLDRLAFVVPAGRWRVELRFGRRRGLVAASWVLSSFFLLLTAFAAVRLSRSRTASPAR